MITGYYHTAFTVSDLDRSIAFYRDLLGLKMSWSREVDGDNLSKLVGQPAAKVRIQSISFGAFEIELIQYVAATGARTPPGKPNTPNTTGTAHVAFFVDDVDAMHRQLRDKGVRFISPPVDFGTAKSCYFTDPDGIVLEILERKAAAAA